MSSKPERQRQVEPAKSSEQTTIRLLLTMADTTWRMIIPTAILATFAVMGDLKFGTKPWLTLLSLPFGLGFSVLLVKRQLGNVQE